MIIFRPRNIFPYFFIVFSPHLPLRSLLQLSGSRLSPPVCGLPGAGSRLVAAFSGRQPAVGGRHSFAGPAAADGRVAARGERAAGGGGLPAANFLLPAPALPGRTIFCKKLVAFLFFLHLCTVIT